MDYIISILENELERLDDLLKFERRKLNFKRIPMNYDDGYDRDMDPHPHWKYSITDTKRFQKAAKESIVDINIAKGEILEAIQIIKEGE